MAADLAVVVTWRAWTRLRPVQFVNRFAHAKGVPYRRVTGVQRFLATAGREPTAACVHTVSEIFVLLRTGRPVPAAIKNERGR